MKNFLLFLLLFSSTSTALAQWVKLSNTGSQNEKIYSSGDKLYICSSNNGFLISSDSGYTFNQSNNGLNTLDTKCVLIRDSLFILGTLNGIYKSINYGASWVLANNGFPAYDSWVYDILIKGDSIFVASGGKGIYCSIDFCQSWFPLNNGISEKYFRCILNNGNIIFAGSLSGDGIYISDDNGLSWVQKNNGVPHSIYDPNHFVQITSFTIINQTIFASTYGGNLLKSDDNGESWMVLDNPNNFIWTVFHIGNTLYTGHSGVGPFKSEDGGESWLMISEGLDYSGAKEVRTFCTLGLYIYATGGYTDYGYVFRRPIPYNYTQMPEYALKGNATVYPNPILNLSRITFTTTQKTNFTLEVFNLLGKCIKKSINLEYDQLVLSRSDYPIGIYIYRISGIGNEKFVGKFIVN